MKILIVGQPSDNRGDEAAGCAMLYGIKEVFPESKITVYYFNKLLTPVLNDKSIVDNLFKQARGSGSFCLLLLLHFLLDKLNLKFFMFNEECKKLLRLIKESNLVLLSPAGPYISDIYDFRNEAIRLICLLMAQYNGRKTMIYGPSMGPFKQHTLRNLFRKFVLNKVDRIIVRDKQSYEHLAELNLRNRHIYTSTDCVFQRKIQMQSSVFEQYLFDSAISKDDKIIGITSIELSWHSYWGKIENLQEKIDDVLAKMADYLIENYSYKILFIPQLFGIYSDMECINRIRNKMRFAKHSKILDHSCNSDIQQMIISRMDYVIGLRHHSVVLATKMLVPSICISYEFKIESYMREIGLEEYVIPLGDLELEKLKRKFQQIRINRDNYISLLNKEISRRRDMAKIYSTQLHELMENEKNCN